VEEILLSITVPLMVILILAEMGYSHFLNKKLYTKGDTVNNLIFTSWNFLNDLAFRGITLFLLIWANSHSFYTFENKGVNYWFLLFLSQDLAYYVLHCCDHYIRLFWASHVTHHNSSKFNFTVAIRSSVFQPFYRWIFYLPLGFVGFEAIDILFMYAACQVYGFWVHTELVGKLSPLFEFIFVTPSHHRVHHASNPEYLDRNMGMVLIIWDRIFGTFSEEEDDVKIEFGLTRNVAQSNPIYLVFHEWMAIWHDIKSAPNIKSALLYIVGPPGWSHDGSRMTSVQMRAAKQNEIMNNRHQRVEESAMETEQAIIISNASKSR